MLNDLTSRILPRWRNMLFVLFVVDILAYSGSFAFLMLTKFDLINIIRNVNNDGSFYLLQDRTIPGQGGFLDF